MANLIKKVVVLTLLLVIIGAVYLVKNKDVREGVLIKLGLAASRDFKIPEDIKIGMEDINIEKLTPAVPEEITPSPEASAPAEAVANKSTGEEGVGVGSVEAGEEEITLEDIEKQVQEISQQVELIKKEVDILISINEIQQEIKELADQENNLSSI